ncbi:DENN domain-containing protein 2B-like [Mantella aurantiaca]
MLHPIADTLIRIIHSIHMIHPIGDSHRSQSVSPPPVFSPVCTPSYPLSDSEEFFQSGRLPSAPGTKLVIKDWTARDLRPPESDPSSLRHKALSVACLDKRLSVFKGPGPKDGAQAGQDADVIGNRQLNRSTLSLGSAANQRPRPHNRSAARPQVPDIRRKISEWECRRDPAPRPGPFDPGERPASEGCPSSMLASPCSDKTFDFRGYRRMSRTFSDCSYPETEEEAAAASERDSLHSLERRPSRTEPANAFARAHARKEPSAVLNRIQKIEQALKANPGAGLPQLPSSCFGVDPGRKRSIASGTLDSDKPESGNSASEPEHVNDKGAKNKPPPPEGPANDVNPVPKPKRTFEYEADKSHRNKPNNGLPPSPSPVSPPPLPSTPAPPVTRRPKKEHRKPQSRKSLEFEDASSVQSLCSPSPVQNGTEKQHRSGSKSTLEENTYEDIVGAPEYEGGEGGGYNGNLWTDPAVGVRRPPEPNMEVTPSRLHGKLSGNFIENTLSGQRDSEKIRFFGSGPEVIFIKADRRKVPENAGDEASRGPGSA